MSDGQLRIDTGGNAAVNDVFSDADLGVGPSISVDVKAGDTRLLKTR
ncbi:MAG: hypothetical protein GXY83_09560 [Rhodopirellula sp.]|nr:hypothetical protein [Rhodopirellula sp.]